MRLIFFAAAIALLASGAGASYVVFKQLDTKTAVIEAAPQFALAEDGSLCGSVTFILEPRTLGYWWLNAEKGTRMSGVATVVGNESLDIGLRVYSPSNRLLLADPERHHAPRFDLPAEIRGEYRFEFDNRHSVFTDKEITVSVCTHSA